MPFFLCFQGSREGLELDPVWMHKKIAGMGAKLLF